MTTVLARRTAPETYERFHPRKLIVDDVEYQPQFFDVAEDDELAAIGVYCVDVTAPSGQRWTEAFADDDGVPVAVFAVVPLADLVVAKLAALADRRWQAETGGVVINGVPIKTDRDSTSKITAAYVQAAANPAFSVRWKVDTGTFVTLDAETIIAIGDAVTTHAQACFDREDVLTTAILGAADAAALDAVDIEIGWPI